MKKNSNQFGTKVAPRPKRRVHVKTKRSRRVKAVVEIIFKPETATDVNKKEVMPPKTELGMATKAAANLEKIPMTIK